MIVGGVSTRVIVCFIGIVGSSATRPLPYSFPRFSVMPVLSVQARRCDAAGWTVCAWEDEISWDKWHGFYYTVEGSLTWAALCPACAREVWRDSSKEKRRLSLIMFIYGVSNFVFLFGGV